MHIEILHECGKNHCIYLGLLYR